MNFGQAFSYPFQDSEWFKKIIISGLISLIPVIGWLYLYGWMLEIMRRVINKETPLLPDDVDFGGNLGRGFQGFIIGFVYAIPLIIFSLPPSLVAPIGQLTGMDSNTLTTVSLVISICCGGLSFIYGILMALVLPAALANFVVHGSMGAGFRFGEVFGLIKAAPGAYVVALLGSLVASIVGQLGVIVCVIGLLLTIPYYMAVMGHFYGQAYNQASGNKSLA
jgi:hypothetical protein